MTALALRRLQRWMAACIVHPADAATALADRRAAALVDPAHVASGRVVAANARMTPAAQLQVYGDGWYARLLDVMRAEFPCVEHLLGAQRFRQVVLRYAIACPSRHTNLNRFGARFPAFLRRTRGARPALAADMARFERAMAEAFDAPSCTPLAADALQAVPQDRWGETCFTMNPSLRVLPCRYAVDAVHAAYTAGRVVRSERPRRCHVAVWCRDERVHWRCLAPGAVRVLRALAAGQPLAAALATAPGGAPVADWFRDFAADGLFIALE